jgi:hypothetical protein
MLIDGLSTGQSSLVKTILPQIPTERQVYDLG